MSIESVMLFLMFAALITLAWGGFARPDLAAAAILMWGTGDAAAALVGIPFGKHKVHSKLTDGKKSWEGTAAMFVTSAFSGILLLLIRNIPLSQALPAVLTGAICGSLTELISPSEYDTVTVPTVIVIVLLLMQMI